LVIEEETIIFREDRPDEETLKLLKMKYKKKYTKIDPNLILKCCEQYKSWMQSLKVLFDWLRLNTDIMLDCYRSNPEFISNIIKLTNFLNIDIFTRKIFFERSMIDLKNVRENLRYLFDIRHQIATHEDIVFKKFALFEELQQPIDWNLNYKLQLTPEEDSVMRNFKMIDFGFYICKMKKFNYSFCSRSRIFVEKQGRRRRERGRRDRDRRDKRRGNRRGGRRERRYRKSECEKFEKLSIKTHSQESQEIEEFPSIEQSVQTSRKGYLRNKTGDDRSSAMKEKNKSEMMGKLGELWLKNEVQNLESRSKPVNINLTPYLMLDTKALIDYLHVVKNLVNTRKFVVLIPRAGG
jgi:protein SMG5